MTNAMLFAAEAPLRFCWLRESAPGHLECDLGLLVERSNLPLALVGLHPGQQRTTAQPPVSLQQAKNAFESESQFLALPEWARKRLAARFGPLSNASQIRVARENCRILFDAGARALVEAPNDCGVELHLPYLDRRQWPARFDILAKSAFRFVNGRVVPSGIAVSPEESNHYSARLVAASLANSDLPLALHHGDRCMLPAGVAAGMHEAAFGQDIEQTAGIVELSIDQQLPFRTLSAWRRAPLEKSPAYFPAHAAVSVAIQRSLRRWVAWKWLSNPARCEDIPATYAILAYAASRLFPGRRRTDFTWDVLGQEWIYAAFHLCGRELSSRLRSVRAALIAAGRPQLAQAYAPAGAKDILSQVRRRNKTVRDFFAGEGEIVNHILRFGLVLRASDHPIEVCHGEAEEFSQGLGTRLRRLSKDMDLTSLGAMIIIEATNALHIALGGEDALHTKTSVSPSEVLGSRAA
jgi:hypothetical protein